MRPGQPLALVVAASALLLCGATPGQDEPPEAPRDSGIVEKVSRDLLQIDVSVRGPLEVVRGLTAADFKVRIAGEHIRDFALDRLCTNGAETTATGEREGPARAGPAAPGSPAAHYLFYFDEAHLTSSGRARAIGVARELVPELLTGAARGTLVSSGERVETLVDWTAEPRLLLEGLDRLDQAGMLRDGFADGEDRRVAEVYRTLAVVDAMRISRRQTFMNSDGSSRQKRSSPAKSEQAISAAMLDAETFRREERSQAERALHRFSAVLARMSSLRPPKAVVYFADTLRSNPGDHYYQLIKSSGFVGGNAATRWVAAGAYLREFEQIINEAATSGTRVYTVQARGLVDETGGNPGMTPRLLGGPTASATRFEDAKSALVGLAVETGGQAFLNGVPPEKMLDRLRQDLGCLYLISLDPAGLPRDRRLGLSVRVLAAGVEVRTRSRVVVASDEARREARLAAALVSPDESGGESTVTPIVVPTGFGKKHYTALVQVILPADVARPTTWDVAVTASSGGELREAAGRVSAGAEAVPAVFEAEMDFEPGPFELAAVAYDAELDRVVSKHTSGVWPSLDETSFGPVALLQPTRAAFVRGEETRTQGPLGRAPQDSIDPSVPTAVVGIVCRGRQSDWPPGARIERRLVGETTAEFAALIPVADERCVLLADVVPAGTLGPGAFRFEMALDDGAGPLAPMNGEPFDFVAEGFDVEGSR